MREALMARVAEVPSGCWIWVGKKGSGGYGSFRDKRPHRLMYEVVVGSIPEGLDLDHLCRVRLCVNPAHLEPVTRSENLRRSPLMGGAQRRKTTCPQNHPYDEHYGPSGRYRRCSTCRREATRRWRAKR